MAGEPVEVLDTVACARAENEGRCSGVQKAQKKAGLTAIEPVGHVPLRLVGRTATRQRGSRTRHCCVLGLPGYQRKHPRQGYTLRAQLFIRLRKLGCMFQYFSCPEHMVYMPTRPPNAHICAQIQGHRR
jgi:hypothetical protein